MRSRTLISFKTFGAAWHRQYDKVDPGLLSSSNPLLHLNGSIYSTNIRTPVNKWVHLIQIVIFFSHTYLCRRNLHPPSSPLLPCTIHHWLLDSWESPEKAIPTLHTTNNHPHHCTQQRENIWRLFFPLCVVLCDWSGGIYSWRPYTTAALVMPSLSV